MLPQIAAIFLATYFLSYFGMACAFLSNSNPTCTVNLGKVVSFAGAVSANAGTRCVLACGAALSYALWVS